MKPKPKQKTKSYYVKKLDDVFSKYIRQKYADDFGMVTCYTCNKLAHYKDMQNGHFISRSVMALRWDEENCRVQCVSCNVFKCGNYIEYTLRLQKEIGKKAVDNLFKRKHEIKQWTIAELKKEIEKYKKYATNS